MPIPALLAPLLSQGLNLIGNAVLAKGKDWVEQKTGVKLDQPLSAEDTVKLRQYEMDHQEELLRLRVEEKKLGLEELQAYMADTDSARDREIQIANSDKAPLLNKVVTPIIALGVLTLSFVLFSILIFIEVRPEAKDILIYVLGVLSAAVTQILSYYFGSSQGSRDKDAKLAALADS